MDGLSIFIKKLYGESQSPKFQFENYVCFHKNYQFKSFGESYAVYLDDGKFYLVGIQKPVTMLMQTDKNGDKVIKHRFFQK